MVNTNLIYSTIEEDLAQRFLLHVLKIATGILESVSLSDKIKVIYLLKYRFGLMGLIRLLHNLAQVHDRHESNLSKGINVCQVFYLHFSFEFKHFTN